MRTWAIIAIAAILAVGLWALRAGSRRSAAASALLDRGALDEIRRLEDEGGTRGLLDEIIDTYLGETPGQLASLEEAVREDDPATLWRTAHGLKSGSVSLGAEAVSDLCRRLEMLGRSGTTKGGRALLDDLHQACAAARRALLAEKTGAGNG